MRVITKKTLWGNCSLAKCDSKIKFKGEIIQCDKEIGHAGGHTAPYEWTMKDIKEQM